MTAMILGIGNPDRADDAVGLRVLDALKARNLPDVQLQSLRGDMLALFDCWKDADSVILVDAMRSGVAPGTIRRLDASDDDVGGALGAFVSTHAFDLGDAIALARTLGRLPRQVILYGIEARDFTPGGDLSEPVRRTVEIVAARIEEECKCTKHR